MSNRLVPEAGKMSNGKKRKNVLRVIKLVRGEKSKSLEILMTFQARQL